MYIKDLYEKLSQSQKGIIDAVIKSFQLDIDKCKVANMGVFNVTLVPTLMIECDGKNYNTDIPLQDIKL